MYTHKIFKTSIATWISIIKKAKNDFENDFFKQMNNAVFGKTIENEKT